ncbi:MAG: hypothetical protein J6C16_00055 [Clostridia bacterium]|nr:hypothetical protein [Clostridia bacterium]
MLALMFAFSQEERLTSTQIENLREQYPIYGDINKINPLIEVAQVETSLEEISKRADTFVYGEVIEEVPVYSIYSYAKFYGYRLKVYKDTENIFSTGEEITIVANTDFKDYNPSLSEGMKVVVPVKGFKSQQGKYNFDVCMYYVTEDGFVLSAFDEKEILDKEYSGIKVEKLLEEI